MNILDNINGYPLDKYQRKAVLCKKENVLVVAGAGSPLLLLVR